MIRDKLMHHEPVDGFRWRSHEIARIEGFSDAVFGFAVTLLVVSLEVPKTSTELLETMRGFGSFVATFVILAGLWHAQFAFFRRYGLEDRKTVVLNLVLLFTVLFFVYPLKFLFSQLLSDPRMKGMVMTAHGMERIVLPGHRAIITSIFAAGFIAVFSVFLLLYKHAYSLRDRLELNEYELFETRHTIRRMTLAIGVGVAYLALGGIEALSLKNEVADYAAMGVSAVFALIMIAIFRLIRERNRVRRAWMAEGGGAHQPPVSQQFPADPTL